MSKEHISATVDPEVADYLDRDGTNRSATINRLVKQQMEAGTTQEELVRMRLEQVQEERETLEDRLERKKEKESELEQRLEAVQQDNAADDILTVAEAAQKITPKEWLSSIPKVEQIPSADSEEIQSLASETEMDPKEFRSKVVDYILSEEGEE